MTKTLVFPDLHQPIQEILDRIDEIITLNQPCHTVFLGDYFDQFGDTPEDSKRMCAWLMKSLAYPQRTHLLGNHDVSYFYPSRNTWCSGNTEAKRKVIEPFALKFRGEFEFHAYVDGILLTHAGLHNSFNTPGATPLREWLGLQAKKARNSLRHGGMHWFYEVSYSRGGLSPFGGILWGDAREFIPVPGLKQIFGHTPGKEPRVIPGPVGELNLCLDTHLHHYAIVQDGTVEIKPFPG